MKCKNCNKEFTVYPEDRAFYAKMDVSEPVECPSCREQHRLSWRNVRTMYNRQCDKCGKKIISIHSPKSEFTVYCPKCWWGDDWNSLDYGRDYDFNRGFFEQFFELLKKVPLPALTNKNSENSDFCNEVDGLKDCYLCTTTFFCERMLYVYWAGWSHDSVDSSFVMYSNLCYECQDVFKCYNCRYVYNSENLLDCTFCFNCQGCQNCFNCFNLINQKYCIDNKQYTKEQYQEKLKEYNLGSRSEVEKLTKKFWQEGLKYPRRFAFIKNSENCSGDYIKDSKNSFASFDIFGHENGRYLYDSGVSKDAVDCSQAGVDCELMYQIQSGHGLYNVAFGNFAWMGRDSRYIDSCQNFSNCLLCSGLRNKKFCILNKQYSPEKYQELSQKIIEEAKKSGEYGEFFPRIMSPFAYNETAAYWYFPMTKEEVLAKGWRWQDNLPGTVGKETTRDIPDDIGKTEESITKEILACEKCKRNYKITREEFDYYKNHNIPVPVFCPTCREYSRLNLRNPRKLWHRQCMCESTEHGHAGRCPVEFETTYAPDRLELVYCEECYRKEIY